MYTILPSNYKKLHQIYNARNYYSGQKKLNYLDGKK